MERIRLSTNLFLDEYIPKDLYLQYSKKPQILIGLIDERVIKADQLLRNKFGSVTINNWWFGGNREWSGLRTKESPYYSPTSQHSFGRASDKLFTHAPAERVRQYIKDNWKELGITCIEEGVSWVHSDVRNWNGHDILIVRP